MAHTTAFIPARGGSERLPDKNKKVFHGKPLVLWTIEQAQDSQVFDKIVVSSDDSEILGIADKAGAISKKRQEELSKDDTDVTDVIYDFFARPENKTDYCCLLNPTHPLRSIDDIIRTYKFVKMKKYDAVITVMWNDILGWIEKPTKIGPMPMYLIDQRPTRKSRDDWYLENGCIYWFKHKVITETGTFIGPAENVKLYEMPKQRSLEIDDAFDWYLCEKAFEYNGNKRC